MKRFSSLWLFLLAALAAFFNVTSVYAQNTPFQVAAEGLTLSPPSFEMTLKPGEETAHTIQVTNPTKNLIELYPSAGNFTANGDGGQPKYEIGTTAIESDSRFSIADWISFYTPKVALLPEQVVEFRFRIKVPENAEPGGHYGVVFLGTKPPEEKDENSQVALSTMVGSLLLVRIPGDVREEARIEEFSAPWFFSTPPVDFTIFLRNTGNIHIRPQGEVALTNWRGENIERIDINPKKGSVLPESRRNFDVAWKPDMPHFWNIPIGKFRATLSVAYGQKGKTLSQQIAFWIIPKWFIITVGILFGLLVLLIIFLIIRRRRKKRRNSSPDSQNPPSAPASSFPPLRPLPPSESSFPSSSFPPSHPISSIPPISSPPHSIPSPFQPLRRPASPAQSAPISPISSPSTQKPDWMNRITASNEATKENKKNMRF